MKKFSVYRTPMSQTPVEIDLIEREGYLEARYLGAYTLDRYKKQMEFSTRACAERDLSLLLVDISGLEAYRPTTMELHEIGVLGASLSRHLDRVAVLAKMEQIGPDPFETTVARNRGLSIRAFQDRGAALQWLLGNSPERPPQD